jgi:uncharacterized iron-regulated membrane protein
MNFFRRFVRRPQELRTRRFNFQIHLWCGVILALYMIAIGVTGSILVFRSELESLSGLKPWHNVKLTEPLADITTVVRNLETSHPRAHIVSVSAPTEADPAFLAVLQGRARITVALHPSTGEVLGEYSRRASWLDVVQELHFSLFAHRTGRIINGIGASLLLLMCFTGLINWWPGIRNWRRALKVDFQRNWRRVNFDLHSAAGFWTLVILSFWAVSGIYFAWPGQVFRFVNRFSPVVNAKPPIVTVTPQNTGGELEIGGMLEQARAIDSGTKLKGIAFPFSKRSPLEVLMRRGTGAGREYEDTLYFDPYTGKYLGMWQYGVKKSLGDWLIWSQVPLHFGTSWGLGIKIIWAVLGLAAPLLAVTGLVMYWNRTLSKKLNRLRQRRAGAMPVAARVSE